ncbi:hypothetical protein D3C84_1232670 [compost metagenome]
MLISQSVTGLLYDVATTALLSGRHRARYVFQGRREFAYSPALALRADPATGRTPRYAAKSSKKGTDLFF